MSNLLFPFPASITNGSRGWDIEKYPVFNTITQTPISRRGETRISTTPYPTWEFVLTFPYVGGTFNDATSYLNQLTGFYMQMQGAANSFLYNDPRDNTITTPVQFGVGDGSTTVFQLTRPIGGATGAPDIVQNLNGQTSIFSNGTNITQRNILTDSDGTGSTWTGDAGLVFSSTGGLAGSGGKWTYTGTGSASTFRFKKSSTINVIPGQTYALSGYIDATHVTAGGPPVWAVENPAVSQGYLTVNQTAGVSGRVSSTLTIPQNVTQVVVIMDTGNCTVTSGQTLTFSNPQLEIAGAASTYQSSNSAPYVLGSNGLVTFATASAAGIPLTWSGQYYFRCRFKNDNMSGLKEVFTNYWTIQQLEFSSVIL